MQPNDIKAFLKRCSNPLNGYATAQQGRGSINLRTALNLAPAYASTQSLSNGNGTGSIDKARGGNYVTVDGFTISGEIDAQGNPWDSVAMAQAVSSNNAWSWDGKFN